MTPSSVPLLVPPHSIEAEQSVLGGLMLVPDAVDLVMDRLVEGDFYRKDHRLIWRAIVSLVDRGDPVDPVTLGDWFAAHGLAEHVGGAAYIAELANNTPSAANIVAYADIVRDRSVLRQLVDASHQTSHECFHPDGAESDEILARAEERVFGIANHGARGGSRFIAVREAVKDTFKEITAHTENPTGLTGLGTGYSDLDKLTTGLQPSDLIVVAARPSMGKTAFAMNIAEHVALKDKRAVAVFSMEMAVNQLTKRMIASIGRVNAQNLRTGQIEEEEWPRITNAFAQLSAAPIFIEPTGGLSPGEIRAKARRIKREHNVALFIIDYMQLMQVPGMKDNRANVIAEVSRSLKALAKELEVPVVALSQLNRSVEQRADKRPLMSDLRESGSIEQDADVIMFIYRDEYYNPDSPDKGLAEIIVAKQRNGPTDTVKLAFNGRSVRFDNAAYGIGSFDDN